MIKALASAFFYARFAHRFSAIGFRRRAAHWAPLRADYRGQTWLVTGASGGIGRAVAQYAEHHGARVLALARSADKLADLVNEASGNGSLEAHVVDLSSMRAIGECTRALLGQGIRIDVLVNNVGVMLDDWALTDEGMERSFATNVLGHFALVNDLHTDGCLAKDGIVINVSSGGMYGSPLKLEPMNAQQADQHDGMAAYAMHKRAQVVLTRLWNQQWKDSGPVAQVMHPGWADTDGVKRSLPWFRAVLRRILRDTEQAADTIVWLATERPPANEEGGIWLDREQETEHAFSFTRNSPNSESDLQSYLSGQLARSRHTGRDQAAP